MRRIYLFLLCGLFAVAAQAHQSTYLYFEDKDGFRDSLEIAVGLSDEEIDALPLATEEEALQAINDSTHWVWLVQGVYSPELKYYVPEYIRTYAYKPFSGWLGTFRKEIRFPISRMPVTITWNPQFFVDNDITGSLLSDMPAWFDATCNDTELIRWVLLAENNFCILHDTSTDGYGCSYESWNEMVVKMVDVAIGHRDNYKESVEIVNDDTPSATKIFNDGHVLIERNGHTYTATGAEVR